MADEQSQYDYQPFPIADLTTGLDLTREPWLLPPVAWSVLKNGHTFRGRVWKRTGYKHFGTLAAEEFPHILVGSAGQTWMTSTLYGNLNTIIVAAYGSYRVEFTDTTQVGYDDGNGNILQDVTAEAIGAPGGTIYFGFIANPPVSDADWVFTDGTQTITFDSTGFPSGDYNPSGFGNIVDRSNGAYVITFAAVTTGPVVSNYTSTRGTIDYATGAYDFNWISPSAPGATACTYSTRRLVVSTFGAADTQNAVMGIANYYLKGGTQFLFAWDRRRMWKWNPGTEIFDELIAFDLWSGEPDDFFVWAHAQDKLVFTNGINPLCYTDGATVTEVNTNWTSAVTPPALAYNDPPFPIGGGGYVRKINSAKFVFHHKDRLVLLYTNEDVIGASPQRLRWSSVDPNLDDGQATWDPNAFEDASTEEFIVAAKEFGDEIIVWFERSVWKVVWTDDYRRPFAWERIQGTYGSVAPRSGAERERDVVAMGATSLVSCNGQEAEETGIQIPDLPSKWNRSTVQYSYAAKVHEQRQVWHTFVDRSESYPEDLLVHNYEDDSYSLYRAPFHCFGSFREFSQLLWDDIKTAWNITNFPFDEKTLSSGFPIVLAGMRTQFIMSVLTATSDNGAVIPFNAMTGRINPYMQSQKPLQRARLGFLDLIASANAEVSLTIRFMADFTNSPYKTVTVNLGANGGEEKVLKRILVNRTARFHRIEIQETSSVQFAIDAIIPWFSPDGSVYPIPVQ